MKPYRVLVVDDSRFMRKIITDIIESDSQFIVVGTAVNGLEAISCVEQLLPDVITLDLEMPQMNGLEALQEILKKHKIPIIMLSGISEANTRDTIRALQYGAIDFIRKPTGVGANANDIVSMGEVLLDKLKVAVLTRRKSSLYKPILDPMTEIKKSFKNSTEDETKPSKNAKIEETVHISLLGTTTRGADTGKINTITNKTDKTAISSEKSRLNTVEPIKREASAKENKKVKPTDNNSSLQYTIAAAKPAAMKDTKITQIVAIGTSTGGPRALHEVISSIPAGIPSPIVVVQHMPPKFTKSLAQRLDFFSELRVVEAEDRMTLENGTVYIAPGGYHMKVVKSQHQYQIELTTDAPRNGHRPSVDILFESLMSYKELERHIVLMTGMGSDGAQGMKALVESGVQSTIAESEETCVVYGMPRSAVEFGIVEKVLPLSQIAPEIVLKVLKRAHI